MRTFASHEAAHIALTDRGFELVATVPGKDSVRHGYSRKPNGKPVESAVLTVFSATCATVRYL